MSVFVADLQYGGIWHRGAGEVLACGWANNKILFRAASATALTADPLDGVTTELEVCDAPVGEGKPIPRSSIVAQDDGSILVVVDDGQGTVRTYRCRSFADGFSEVAA